MGACGLLTSVAALAAPAPERSDTTAYAAYLKDAALQIDKHIAAGFKRNKIEVPPLVDDTTFLRRTFLNTVGRIPTLEEARFFVEAEDEDKRAQMISYLLDSPGYNSHTLNWINDLFRVRDSVSRTLHPYVFYLRDSIAANKPWDEMTHELLSAKGSLWENGAVGYYLMDKGMEHDNLAISMRVFLGTRMECAQCHDNPEFLDDDWERKEFFELAAFVEDQGPINNHFNSIYQKYRNAEAEVSRGEMGSLVSDVFNTIGYNNIGSGGKGRTKLPRDYQYRDGEPGEMVGARTPFGPGVRGSDKRDMHDGRTKLADWVISDANPRYAQTIANRLWKRIMGTGLYEPVDEFTEPKETPNPALTNYLSQLIKDLDYDIKAFQQVLLMTHTYQFAPNPVQHGKGQPYHFNGRQLTRLSPEQLWDSLLTLQMGDPSSLPTRKFDNRVWINGRVVLEGKLTMSQLSKEIFALKSDSAYQSYFEDLLARIKADGGSASGGSMMQRGASGWNGLRGFVRASELESPVPADHFLRQFGQSDRLLVEGNTDEANVSQILAVLNGHVQRHIVQNPNISMYKMLEDFTSPEDKIRGLFLATLTRPPNDQEVDLMMGEYERSGEKAFANITAALLCTHEFLFLK